MAEMSSMWKIEAHETVMWFHQSLVYLQVCWASTQALHVDTPLLGVEMECLQRSLLTCELNSVNVLVSTIVSCSWISFRVLVGHGGAKCIEDSP